MTSSQDKPPATVTSIAARFAGPPAIAQAARLASDAIKEARRTAALSAAVEGKELNGFLAHITGVVQAYLGGTGEGWDCAMRELLPQAINLLTLSGRPLTLDAICKLVSSAPRSLVEAAAPEWAAGSRDCAWVILDAEERTAALQTTEPGQQAELVAREFAAACDYWLTHFPSLDERTRNGLLATFAGIAPPPATQSPKVPYQAAKTNQSGNRAEFLRVQYNNGEINLWPYQDFGLVVSASPEKLSIRARDNFTLFLRGEHLRPLLDDIQARRTVELVCFDPARHILPPAGATVIHLIAWRVDRDLKPGDD